MCIARTFLMWWTEVGITVMFLLKFNYLQPSKVWESFVSLCETPETRSHRGRTAILWAKRGINPSVFMSQPLTSHNIQTAERNSPMWFARTPPSSGSALRRLQCSAWCPSALCYSNDKALAFLTFSHRPPWSDQWLYSVGMTQRATNTLSPLAR